MSLAMRPNEVNTEVQYDCKKNFVSLILGTVGGTVNTRVGEIAGEVGITPTGWNGGIFNMIRGLSETVIVPIAGIRLFGVADIVNGGFQR